jgi:AbrB family looped-hinge helix DNA binding protein
MEEIGITKEIDDLGRLQIPKEIRKRLGLEKNVMLIVTSEGLLVKNNTYRLIKVSETEKK